MKRADYHGYDVSDRSNYIDSVSVNSNMKLYTTPIKGIAAVVLSFFFSLPNLASADLLEGLVAWWPLDGNVIDASGNGNDGQVIGPVPCEDRFGSINGAMCFDGDVEDLIDIGNGVKPSFPLTISAWIQPDVNDLMSVIRNDSFWPYYYGVVLGLRDTGQIFFHYGDGGYSSGYSRITGETAENVIISQEWQHIAIVLNAHRDIRLYWNCEEYAIEWDEQATGSGLAYSSANGAIGHRINTDRQYQGSIDDVRVYNRSLSSEDIELFCKGADLSIDVVDDPDPVTLRATINYDIEVTNNGPELSEETAMTAILSRGVKVMPPVQSSQGVCEFEQRSNSVHCELDYLNPAETASVSIRARPNRPGSISLTATTEATETADPNPGNNTVTEYTTVKRD